MLCTITIVLYIYKRNKIDNMSDNIATSQEDALNQLDNRDAGNNTLPRPLFEWHYYGMPGVFQSIRSWLFLRRFLILSTHYILYFNNDYPIKPNQWAKVKRKTLKQPWKKDNLRTQINYRILPAAAMLNKVGSPINYRQGNSDEFNIILDFLSDEPLAPLEKYFTMRDSVEKAMGVYKFRVKLFFTRQLWSPIFWISFFIMLPLRVLEISGFNVDNEKTAKIYFWVLQITMAILMAILIASLAVHSILSFSLSAFWALLKSFV